MEMSNNIVSHCCTNLRHKLKTFPRIPDALPDRAPVSTITPTV